MIAAYDDPHLPWSSPVHCDEVEARAAEEWALCRRLDGDLGVPLAHFVAHVRQVAAARAGDDAHRLSAVLDRLVWRDVHLALGCLARSERAVRLFLSRFGDYLHHLSHRSAPDSATGDDIEQTLRATLFLPRDPSQPESARLASYRGTGSLAGWLRVIARRLVIDEVRKLRRLDHDPSVEAEPAPEPRLDETVARVDAAMRLAPLVRAAFADLDAEEQDLLRWRYRDALVLREIADKTGRDIATVHRRVASVNAKLWKRIRGRAREDLGLDERDLRALLGALAEQIRLDDLLGLLLAAAFTAPLVLKNLC